MKLLLSISSQLILASCLSAAVLQPNGQENNAKVASVSPNKVNHAVSEVEEFKERKSNARKREIPDALVDHPEEFEESLEELRESPYEKPSQDDEFPLPSSNLDDDEREYYTKDERKKRAAFQGLGRKKRNLQMNPETAAILFQLLNSGVQYQQQQPRARYPWTNIVRQQEIEPAVLNNKILEDSDDYVEGYSPQHGFLPVPQIHLPTYQRNIL